MIKVENFEEKPEMLRKKLDGKYPILSNYNNSFENRISYTLKLLHIGIPE